MYNQRKLKRKPNVSQERKQPGGMLYDELLGKWGVGFATHEATIAFKREVIQADQTSIWPACFKSLSSNFCLNLGGDTLHFIQHTKCITTPQFADFFLSVSATHKFQRNVEGFRCIIPALHTATTIKV